MNRIGLVTIYSKNYGSVLQCYATKKFLRNEGITCDTLYHKIDGKEKLFYRIRKAAIVIYYSVKYKGFFKEFVADTKAQHQSINSLSKKSEVFLDDFTRDILKPKGYTNAKLKMASANGDYIYFLAGADQIWNGGRIIDPFMFLCFCENRKRIALAPSFGTGTISDFNKREFRKRIGSFYRLSARELSGQQLITELTNRRCERVSDPVLFLSREEWSLFGNKCKTQAEKNYIFVHFLDKPSDFAISVIESISQSYNLNILCFAYPHDEYGKLKSFEFLDGSPYDYVHLIEHACFVCTDSFHTTQFSIIFDKRFYIFERNYTHRNSQQARLETLTSLYSCEDRYIRKEFHSIESLDFKSDRTYKNTVIDEHNLLVDYIKSSIKI